MVTCTSHNPQQTEELGIRWGKDAKPGLVIGLSGELGSGKTQLVKGLARGLGIRSRIFSPTFSLINIYEGGNLVLNHLDLYRLDTREQVISAGLEEYFCPAGVTVVEWIERWVSFPLRERARVSEEVPQRFRMVWLEVVGELERRITYEDFGV